LSGRDLPTDQTLAAHASVCARAQEYKDSGAFPDDTRMDQYRAAAYLDLLNGITASTRIAAGYLVTATRADTADMPVTGERVTTDPDTATAAALRGLRRLPAVAPVTAGNWDQEGLPGRGCPGVAGSTGTESPLAGTTAGSAGGPHPGTRPPPPPLAGDLRYRPLRFSPSHVRSDGGPRPSRARRARRPALKGAPLPARHHHQEPAHQDGR
jgi:hypothetical protein